MNDSWNMNGPFSMDKVPDELLDFVPQKQQQIVTNVVTSAGFGILLSNFVSILVGEGPSFAILFGTTKAVLPIFALVGIASGLTTLVNNNKEITAED